jgi:hypothetical protein
VAVARAGLILEEYVHKCGPFAAELRKQQNTIQRLQNLAEFIAHLKTVVKAGKT